jgi:hypothetical protein
LSQKRMLTERQENSHKPPFCLGHSSSRHFFTTKMVQQNLEVRSYGLKLGLFNDCEITSYFLRSVMLHVHTSLLGNLRKRVGRTRKAAAQEYLRPKC